MHYQWKELINFTYAITEILAQNINQVVHHGITAVDYGSKNIKKERRKRNEQNNMGRSRETSKNDRKRHDTKRKRILVQNITGFRKKRGKKMTIIEKIEKAGWDVKKEGKELFIQKYSGEGEDFFFYATKPYAKSIADYAEDFDPDEHAKMWYGQHRGEPESMRDLLNDADDIKADLLALAKAVGGLK